ncbi:hypothetical protein D9615_004561 [Tricholomella constricta]|uniref:GRF-type domain-containing protein n=1 Tax=Tricholomella constricta TaxID=117010 RepID=A0A8H5HBT6_9AGAR|nr:hypothetical protein D9615_004561 [Tricholomella constricta]
MFRVHSITPTDKAGVVRCYSHGLEAALRTSHTEKNPGRQYYCCSKGMSDPDRCSFWFWADDPMFKRRQNSSTSVETPSSSFSSHSMSQPHDNSPSTPQKRAFQPSLSSPELTPSQKRTKLIKEALRNTTPSQVRSPGPTSSSSQGSQKRLDDIKRALTVDKSSHTFEAGSSSGHAVGMHLSPSRPRTTAMSYGPMPDKPSTTTQPASNITHENSDADEDAALWALVTPPNSCLETGFLSDEHGINVGSASENGEGATLINDEPTHWRSNDPENPFDGSIPQSQVTNSTSMSDPYVSASTSLRNTAGLSADAIYSLIAGLNDIPDYVRKLERKAIAAERSNLAKARRISDLEEVVERLNEEIRVLQLSFKSKPREF